jgi:aspartyl-tRNA synthetase
MQAKHVEEKSRIGMTREDQVLVVMTGDNREKVLKSLGKKRLEYGEISKEKKEFEFCWVIDFPLFELY